MMVLSSCGDNDGSGRDGSWGTGGTVESAIKLESTR